MSVKTHPQSQNFFPTSFLEERMKRECDEGCWKRIWRRYGFVARSSQLTVQVKNVI